MKNVFMMLGFIFLTVVVFAQPDSKADKYRAWTMFALGINLSNITGDNPKHTPVPGVLLGIRTRIANLSNDAGLDVGIEYSMQGGKYKSMEYIPGGDYGTSSATTRLNYLNFPLLVRYQREPRHGFFAEAGVQPGFLLSAKDDGENIKDGLNKFDVGIPVGVGYQFQNRFGVGLRVTPGLMNINKDEQYKNRNIVVSLRASYTL